MVLEEWQLEHFFHVIQMAAEFKGLQVFMIQLQSTWRSWEMVMTGYIFTVKIDSFIITLHHQVFQF